MTKLQATRKRLGMTQERVALLSGITARTLSSHETGRGRRMPYAARNSVSRILGCDVSYFFTKEGKAK